MILHVMRSFTPCSSLIATRYSPCFFGMSNMSFFTSYILAISLTMDRSFLSGTGTPRRLSYVPASYITVRLFTTHSPFFSRLLLPFISPSSQDAYFVPQTSHRAQSSLAPVKTCFSYQVEGKKAVRLSGICLQSETKEAARRPSNRS